MSIYGISRRKLLSKLIGLFRHEEWNVGIIREPIFDVTRSGIAGKVSWLPAPVRGSFRADPFGIRHNDELFILYEKYDYSNGIGRIAGAICRADGSVEEVEIDIECPFHIAYPYLFRHNDAMFCVPETSSASEVRLYMATDFPRKWKHVQTLVRGVRAVDVTIFHHGHMWWMWFTDAGTDSQRDLHVWYSKDLEGGWTPHAKNPVKSCLKSSRSAGTPFLHEGRLYRPAQDCSKRYGASVVINEVLRLTPTEYEERAVSVLLPDPESIYREGFHTISSAGEWTLVDSKRTIFLSEGLKLALRKYLRFLGQNLDRAFCGARKEAL